MTPMAHVVGCIMECIHKFMQILLLKMEEVCILANNHKNFRGGTNETKAANVHEIMYNAPSCVL